MEWKKHAQNVAGTKYGFVEFEEWLAICARVGGVGSVGGLLAWVVC